LISLFKRRHSSSQTPWTEEDTPATVIDSGDTENDEQFLNEDDERFFCHIHTVVTTQVVSIEVHEEYGVMLVIQTSTFTALAPGEIEVATCAEESVEEVCTHIIKSSATLCII